MAKHRTRKSAPVQSDIQQAVAQGIEQVATAPVVEVSAPVAPAAKKARYAPVQILIDNAVITWVKPNPKRGKSADRYAKFYRVGVSVAQLVQEYKAANLGPFARPDLRWDVEHGNITLGMPQAVETTETTETTES